MSFIELIWAYILVFLFAAVPFFEVVGVISIGILAGLSTVPVVVMAFLGNLITMVLVILLGDKIKNWNRKRKGKSVQIEKIGQIEHDEQEDKSTKRSLRAKKIWKKYGLPGLAFIGPFLVGSHLAAFMSISLGGSRKSTILWMTSSLIFWSIVIAVLAHLGADFIYANSEQEGFLIRYLK